MDLVKEVELPEGDRDEMVRDLLSEGVGEIVMDGSEDVALTRDLQDEGKSGKQLLEWATRRAGDYYAHRIERKAED